MQAVNIRSFKQKVRYHKKAFRKFLGKVEAKPPKNINTIADEVDAAVWKEIDCLSCGNCCKKMSPTFTHDDIKRIARFLNMTEEAFREKWLYFDKKDGDWMNKKQPCQFLNVTDNKCSIYEVRPADCAGFPHLKKKKVTDYIHVHQQNVEYCPATFRMVELWMEKIPVK